MNSRVTVHLVGGKEFPIVLPTDQATELVRWISNRWLGHPAAKDEFAAVHEFIYDGARVRVNPAHVAAVEIT